MQNTGKQWTLLPKKGKTKWEQKLSVSKQYKTTLVNYGNVSDNE